MNVFFFGEQQLYGVYHEPTSFAPDASGIIICNPIGQEYMRSYWVIKQLAVRLADKGHHVLRFDYSHTGNSAGHNNETTCETWTQDIYTATQELADITGITKCCLIGLRLGALLAAVATAEKKYDTAVLWEPVLSGNAHLQQLDTLNRNVHQTRLHDSQTGENNTNYADLLGYPYPPLLRQSLDQAELKDPCLQTCHRVFCVSPNSAEHHQDLNTYCQQIGHSLKHLQVNESGNWTDPDKIGESLLYKQTLDIIAEAI